MVRPNLSALFVVAAMALAAFAGRAAEQAKLPAGAKGFAGMIAGEVVSVADGQLVLAVSEVTKTWKHSAAEQPASLVGQKVMVQPAEGNHAASVAKFIGMLKAGDKINIDVRNKAGDVLTLVELTAEQREKVRGK